MDAGAWSSENTFMRFYDKPIPKNDNYGEHVVSLDSHTKQYIVFAGLVFMATFLSSLM